MTKKEFLNDYYCKVTQLNQINNTVEIKTEAVRRVDGKVIDSVKTTLDIHETNDWIVNYNYSWDYIVEKAKRGQLDYFAQRAQIENYFPINSSEVPDISDMYE